MSTPVPGWPKPDPTKIPLPEKRGALGWLPRWRIPTWLLLIWSGLIGAWLFSAVVLVADACDNVTGESRDACLAGTAIGGGLAITFILFIWFMGFVVLGLVWLMSRPQRRPCPRCGYNVKKGLTTCPHCAFEFGTQAPVGPWGQP